MNRLFLFSVIIWLTACSSKEVIVKQATNNILTQVSTYSLFERESSFTEQQNISDNMRNSIELAIEKEFDQQGLNYQNPDNAEVIIAYELTGLPIVKPFTRSARMSQCKHCNVAEKERARKNRNPNPSRKEKQRRHNAIMKADEERNVGDLVLNVLDRSSLKTLWQGQYPLDIEAEDSSFEVQTKIREAVMAMMQAMKTPENNA